MMMMMVTTKLFTTMIIMPEIMIPMIMTMIIIMMLTTVVSATTNIMMQVGFSWVQFSFYGFSRFQVGFSWFQVGCFKVSGGFFIVFMVPGRFFHSSRLVFHDSVSVFMAFHSFRCFFHGFRSISFWVFKDPGWFFMVENTPKGTFLMCILAPRSWQAYPTLTQ